MVSYVCIRIGARSRTGKCVRKNMRMCVCVCDHILFVCEIIHVYMYMKEYEIDSVSVCDHTRVYIYAHIPDSGTLSSHSHTCIHTYIHTKE